MHTFIGQRCPMRWLFRNPYHLAAVLFARFVTNAATILWSIIVLIEPDVLAQSRYAFVAKYIHENLLAAIFGAIAVAQMAVLILHKDGRGVCHSIGYAVISFAFTFIFAWNVLDPFMTHGIPYATATSLSAPMAFVALYAFLDGGAQRGATTV